MKVQVDHASVHIDMQFSRSGSILQETIEGKCESVQVHMDVESLADRDRVQSLIRNAEQGCYVMQSLRHPVDVQASYNINGDELILRE